MTDQIQNLVFYLGGPYAILFSLDYIKRVRDPKIIANAFDKSTFTNLEKYESFAFVGFSILVVYLSPVGVFRNAIPAAGLGMANALSTINRGRRIQAFFAYF